MNLTVRYKKTFDHSPKVGVALSGGGLRGAAHIGVLKTLFQANIPIHFIAGTSAGAVVAAMFACGYPPYEIEKMSYELPLPHLIDLNVKMSDLIRYGVKWLLTGKFKTWSVLPKGLVKGEKVERFLMDILGSRTFRQTRIPLAIPAVDVYTSDTVFFTTPQPGLPTIPHTRFIHNAAVYEAVRASIAIPGIFFPKIFRNMLLVDGGVKDNVPTDVLHYLGAEIIIAIDLSYDGQPNYEIQTIGEILSQCLDIMRREINLLKSERYADFIIRPDFSGLSSKSLRQIPVCVKRGEQAGWKAVNDIKAVL